MVQTLLIQTSLLSLLTYDGRLVKATDSPENRGAVMSFAIRITWNTVRKFRPQILVGGGGGDDMTLLCSNHFIHSKQSAS